MWIILDHGVQHGTGCGNEQQHEAEKALSAYLGKKHAQIATRGPRVLADISIEDVLALYLRDVVPGQTRPKESGRRAARLQTFFKNHSLADINGPLCREFARQCSTDAMARRDLEDLRSAINHHRREGLHDRIVSIVMPDRRPARERWLNRNEAARLLHTAWRSPKCKQVAAFIRVALYTGRRASVVCRASFEREKGRPWIDLANGFLWPPERAKITNKRNPPIPLPARLLAFLRPWHRNGRKYVVDWNGRSVTRVDPTVKKLGATAGLGDDVTPHVLRHTAATWQMQAGTDMFEAGKFLGMTTRTLEATYAHHRPEHLTSARDAYSRMRRSAPTVRQRNANDTP